MPELPSDFEYPRTLATIREAIPSEGFVNGCSGEGHLRECWQCIPAGCVYRAKRNFDGWRASCSLSVFEERHVKSCSVSGVGIVVSQKLEPQASQIKLAVVRESGRDLHEYRPVYVTVDNQLFTSPEDGPYVELELRSQDGVLVSSKELLELISSANRITTQSWDVSDKKMVKTDRGQGFSDARKFIFEFEKWTL